jgi:hypothetical protein
VLSGQVGQAQPWIRPDWPGSVLEVRLGRLTPCVRSETLASNGARHCSRETTAQTTRDYSYLTSYVKFLVWITSDHCGRPHA